jgi:hypothetical protein
MATSTTYNGIHAQHADRPQTPFELMFGESPVEIPLSFENTKYPAIKEKMMTLLRNCQEPFTPHSRKKTKFGYIHKI